MSLFLWSFQSGGSELFAVSTGRTPPAELHLLKDWKRLRDQFSENIDQLRKMSFESPTDVLTDIGRDGYHLFETKLLRPEWVRPADA